MLFLICIRKYIFAGIHNVWTVLFVMIKPFLTFLIRSLAILHVSFLDNKQKWGIERRLWTFFYSLISKFKINPPETSHVWKHWRVSAETFSKFAWQINSLPVTVEQRSPDEGGEDEDSSSLHRGPRLFRLISKRRPSDDRGHSSFKFTSCWLCLNFWFSYKPCVNRLLLLFVQNQSNQIVICVL